ncbi:MAG: hypothetical protein QS748_10315 [Candidatus Endonucleobacter bathymodioli]|uniref:Uncharacterized protein n=1 Tax=Candidatus Endonucleibacter bathymodioli TaxID=539814 RepID=A0AA90NUF3_9GAMM|nr:hypothetical protein [Candidatus Endonucleobacter bathymodioli]
MHYIKCNHAMNSMDGVQQGSKKQKKGKGSACFSFMDNVLQGCMDNKNKKDDLWTRSYP